MSQATSRPSRRSTLAVLIALLALVVALGGPSYAAKLITGKNIKNSSVTGQDLKDGSVTGKDLKNGSVAGADVKDGSLSRADLAAGAVTAVTFPRVRVTATSGADAATAQANAPQVPLFRSGAFTVYGKCWNDATNDVTSYGTFIRTSVSSSIFDSRNDSLAGGPNVDDFLNTGSLENDRMLEDGSANANSATMDGEDESDFTAFAPTGTTLRGWTGGAVKNGNLAGGNGIYGGGDVCLFTGGAFVG